MAIVSLALFKKHVRADDFTEDDEYLQHLLDTAEESVVTATNRPLEDLTGGDAAKFPLTLRHAVLMLAAHWYNQRESVASVQLHAVPDALMTLVKPHTRLTEDASRKT